jgi:hypothetical protein
MLIDGKQKTGLVVRFDRAHVDGKLKYGLGVAYRCGHE